MQPQRGVEVTRPIQFGNCATSATVEVAPASLAFWPKSYLDRGWLAWIRGTYVPVQSGRPHPSPVHFARQDPCPPFPHTFCKIPLQLNSTSDRDDNTQSRTALQESTVKKSDKMAQEISDIKKVGIDNS